MEPPHEGLPVIKDLERVQMRATKLVSGLRIKSYKERLMELKLPTLKYRKIRGDMWGIKPYPTYLSVCLIDREFEFYKFFSFLKFNKFYEFFSVEKNSQKIRNLANHRCLTCFDVLECNVHL